MKANLYPGRGTRPDWNDIEILGRDCKPPHAYRIPFPDMVSCRLAVADNRRYLSPFVIVLNQGWECRYYASILQMPDNILSFRSGFNPADVPGFCQDAVSRIDGEESGDYHFPVIPPLVPSNQPVIVYRRTCKLPLFWGGLRKHLVLQGVRSAGHVFINGRLAGYTQGTGLPAEFDLTAYLHDGDNELFILVYPECAGRYLEHPSEAPAPGLIHDVYLEAVPPIAIEDIVIKTLPSPDQEDASWVLDLTLTVVSCRISLESPQIRLMLCEDDQPVSESNWQVHLEAADPEVYAQPVQTTGCLKASIQLSGIQPWHDESPKLYDLFIGLEERGSRELVCVHQLVGFRYLAQNDQGLLLNGRPLLLKAAILPTGLNGQPATANYAGVIGELRKLKQNHLNTLYVRHVPADPILLELCDIFGIYVIDEAPLEAAHPLVRRLIADDPAWQAAARDRLERLIRRDRNHPCVVLWSAGIFGEQDAVTDVLAESARKLDDSRMIHRVDTPDCAADFDRWRSKDAGVDSLSWLSPPALPGIGRSFLQLGEKNKPDLLEEVRQILSPLEIKAIDAASGAFTMINRMNWTTTSCFDINWSLLKNGQEILAGKLDSFRAEPGADHYVEIWYGEQNFLDGADYLIRFEIIRQDHPIWQPSGETAFNFEFPIASSVRAPSPQAARSGGRLRLESDRHHLIVSGSRFWLVFNRVDGSLESWRIGDKELLSPVQSDRESTANGLSGLLGREPEALDSPSVKAWEAAGYAHLTPCVLSVEEGCDGQNAVIEMILQLAPPGRPALFEWITRYEIFAAGDLKIFISLHPLKDDLPQIPCFGLNLAMKAEYDQVSWFGGGPRPSFSRRQNSSRTGVYQATAGNGSRKKTTEARPADQADLDAPGIFANIRWLSLHDKTGFGLSIKSGQLFGFAIKRAVDDEFMNSILELRPNHRPIQVRLCQELPDQPAAQPIKAVWHLTPVVSDSGRG